MKFNILFLIIFCFTIGYSQSLPIDFESTITTDDFIDFDGGTASVIPNPQSSGINKSTMVAQIIRNGGEIWAGSKIDLAANLEFTSLNSISMKVFTSAPVGTIVKFKLEGNGTTERDVPTTVSNEWETMTWDFTGVPTNFNSIVFMFDFGNTGDGSANSTFLFDDIQQEFGGTHIDLPVDFEGSTVNYTTTDFGGNISTLTTDPDDENNNVIQAIKTQDAATWAGTTIGTPAGFASNIPLSLTDSKMTVRVWSPESNTPIRLKVEASNDPTQTCETETRTTVAGGWEILEFDFTNEAPGTQSLNVGLSMGWTYNMASIFFNFGTEGATAGETTYYFDDVQFGGLISSTSFPKIASLQVFPNPSSDSWTIKTDTENIKALEIYDAQGKLLLSSNPEQHTINLDGTSFISGMYITKISTDTSVSFVRLVKN